MLKRLNDFVNSLPGWMYSKLLAEFFTFMGAICFTFRYLGGQTMSASLMPAGCFWALALVEALIYIRTVPMDVLLDRANRKRNKGRKQDVSTL